jgi:creatinine amidohydrolase
MSDVISRDILAGTIAEMTWFEVEDAARAGAILLWAFGVIEQHGPHLPTGTDVYLPSALLREIRRELERRGIRALIVPPYYWGVNVVSGAFPASYRVRPALMAELMADVFASFASDGFKQVFCFSGHGDALHNQTLHAGVTLGFERSGLDTSFVADRSLAARIGLDTEDARLTLYDAEAPGPDFQFMGIGQTSRYCDVHAGRWETSMMQCVCPALVREKERARLEPTRYGKEDLAVWRMGNEHARRKTPLGYFGDPAAATMQEGESSMRHLVRLSCDAIQNRTSNQKENHK